jgi:hypothetical protein
MKALQEYVNKKNSWNKLFGTKPMVIGEDNQRIADCLDADMSPENITCDGERPASQVRELYAFYTKVARELRAVDATVKLYEA